MKENFKNETDNEMINELIRKLIKVDINERIKWEDYFNDDLFNENLQIIKIRIKANKNNEKIKIFNGNKDINETNIKLFIENKEIKEIGFKREVNKLKKEYIILLLKFIKILLIVKKCLINVKI